MQKKWVIAEPITQEFQYRFPEIHPVILQLLHNRGIKTQQEIDEFLNPDWGEDIHDPFLFHDMRKAVERISNAIERKESIVVYGDYDADGVCSATLLYDILTALGAHHVHVHLPHRETEGYGLNMAAVKELIKKRINLIITCDCGTSNVPEITAAQEKGIDVIVTDHHHDPAVLPEPFAFINPQLSRERYPFRYLAGSGVAFKLAQALVAHDKKHAKKLSDGYEKWLLDLVAISTVTDMMRLVGENRTLVHYGLVVLRKSRRVGIQELVRVMGGNLEKLDTFSLGFQIGPRLNAAGRVDHANVAFELLIEKDRERAKVFAEKLNQKNKQRQSMTESMVKDAEKQLGTVTNSKKILFVKHKSWSIGLIGLVAGRLADRYHRPVFALTYRGTELVASGRSIPQFDITQSLVDNASLFTRFGGHAQACGFTMPGTAYDQFIDTFTRVGKKHIGDADLTPSLETDMEIRLEDITWDLYESIEKFEPFGENNRQPRFIARGVTLADVQPVGKDGKHLRLLVTHASEVTRKVIAFGFGNERKKHFPVGKKIDMVFEVSVNEWSGSRELQLKLIDMNPLQ